jgi:hypothetical protein
MTLYVFLLPLMFFLIFSLVRLCYPCWLHHWPGRSAATARRTPIRHLLTLIISGYGRGPRRVFVLIALLLLTNQKFYPSGFFC